MELWSVTVFISGDGTTSTWGIFSEENLAEAYKKEIIDSELNTEGDYVEVHISKHELNSPVKI